MYGSAMYSQYNKVPRGLIYFAQGLGTFVAVAMTLSFIIMAKQIFQNLNLKLEPIVEYGVWAITIALLNYLTWKTFYTGIVICLFIKNHDDEAIIANKFVIATLSLSLGGFLTPWILTRMPNINSSSTINPKVWIGRHLGVTLSIGSIIFATIYFGLMVKHGAIIFDSTIIGIMNMVSLLISIIGIGFGLLSNAFFCQKNAYKKYDLKNLNGLILRLLSIIWLVIATIELIFVSIFALLRILGAIFDLISSFNSTNNGIFAFLTIFAAFARLALTLLYSIFIMKMVGETIAGIWHKNNIVEYHYYEALGAKQQKLQIQKQ